MAIFDENKLKEEEIKSGFQPGEPDDDSFLLESKGAYPGQFTTFDDLESEPIIDFFNEGEDSPQKNESEQNVDANEVSESLWDQFDSDTSEIVSSPQETSPVDEQKPSVESVEPIEPIDVEPQEVDKSATVIPGQDFALSSESDEAPSNIVFDEDFKKQLEEELRNKKEKKSKKKEIQEETLIEIPPDPDFKPVEEREKKFEFIDLGNMFDGDVSTNEGNIATEPIPVIEKKKAKVIKEKKVKENKPPKEKKKKGLIYWLFVAAAILAILTVTTYFSLDYLIKSPEKKHKDSLLTAHKAEKQKQEKPAEKIVEQDKSATQKEEPKKIDSATKENQAKPQIETAKVQEKPVKVQEQPAKTQSEGLTKTKEIKEKKAEIKRQIPNYSYAQPVKPKKKFFPKAAIEPKSEKEIEEKELEIAEDNKTSIKEKAVYTIQVYSTPSYEDAKLWLDKLLSLNIPTARIVQQKIRDITWYRIRFGNYQTKDEALNAAKRLGFSQTWVDRIK